MLIIKHVDPGNKQVYCFAGYPVIIHISWIFVKKSNLFINGRLAKLAFLYIIIGTVINMYDKFVKMKDKHKNRSE